MCPAGAATAAAQTETIRQVVVSIASVTVVHICIDSRHLYEDVKWSVREEYEMAPSKSNNQTGLASRREEKRVMAMPV